MAMQSDARGLAALLGVPDRETVLAEERAKKETARRTMPLGQKSQPPNTCVYCGIRSWRLEPDGENLWACRSVSSCEARIKAAQ